MKSVKVFTLIMALMVIVVLAGCPTTDKAKDIKNPELSAAFDAITAQLLERGLEWE